MLTKLDIFSYIPVPHTYPISTNKSKTGSLIFICIIVGYFVYDFVQFLTSNTPVINGYVESTPIDQKYAMPDLAFAFIYGVDLNQTLTQTGYFDF